MVDLISSRRNRLEAGTLPPLHCRLARAAGKSKSPQHIR